MPLSRRLVTGRVEELRVLFPCYGKDGDLEGVYPHSMHGTFERLTVVAPHQEPAMLDGYEFVV